MFKNNPHSSQTEVLKNLARNQIAIEAAESYLAPRVHRIGTNLRDLDEGDRFKG